MRDYIFASYDNEYFIAHTVLDEYFTAHTVLNEYFIAHIMLNEFSIAHIMLDEFFIAHLKEGVKHYVGLRLSCVGVYIADG